MPAASRWRELGAVLVTAVVSIAAIDFGLGRVSPPKHVREVRDAMRDYEHEDPTVLVLGSSHARTFDVMDRIARRRTGDRARIMAVPLEWGKFRSYEWVLEHRVVPLVDERQGAGPKRPSLQHFVLLAAWWDATWYDGDPPVFNLPSRAWSFRDFVASVSAEGLNDYSRNYVTSRWLDVFHGSILATDRGHNLLVSALRERSSPLSDEAKAANFDRQLASWQALMERGETAINHPAELAAAERILAWAQARGLDVTLMLYPMMPITVTQRSREHVQAPFQAAMKALAARRGVRFIDTTFAHNVTDADFQPDFDHLTAEGHKKFSEWLLDGQMRFLLDGPEGLAAGRAPGAGESQ